MGNTKNKELRRLFNLRYRIKKTSHGPTHNKLDTLVSELVKVNPKIMQRQVYKASELKKILK